MLHSSQGYKHRSLQDLIDDYYILKNSSALSKLSFEERMDQADKIIKHAQTSGFYFYRRNIKRSKLKSSIIEFGKDEDRPIINLASNDYLHFSKNSEVIQAQKEAIEIWGIGSGSVPMLAGTMQVHTDLEQKMAKFTGYESCLTFNSGYAANYGILSSMLNSGDAVILDSLVHASIIDGCIHPEKFLFLHNDMNSLKRALIKSEKAKNKLIVVDGVYSMDGDIARLHQIRELADMYGAHIMVDDAHGIGVMGNEGRGTQQYLKINQLADLLTGSFGKALAGIGGFVCCRKGWVHYFEMMSRPFMFSSSMPPGNAVALIKQLDLLENQHPSLNILWENTHYFSKKLRAAGFDIGLAETPIIPIIIREESKVLEFCKFLDNQGIIVNPIIYPVVSKNKSRLRLSLNAGITRDELDYCLDKIIKMGKRLAVI